MKRLFSIFFIIISCTSHKTTEPLNNIKSKNGVELIHKESYKLIDDLELTGDFDGDGIIDTITQNNINSTNNQLIDSIPDTEWDTIVDYLYKKNSDVIITSSIKSIDTLHLGTGLGLNCLINIGDNNKDKKDEIALVIDYCDFSRVNSCRIYQICANKWTLLNKFGIYEGAFDFYGDKSPIFKNIPEYLEYKDKNWYYMDYNNQEYETQEEVGKMKKIKLNGC